MSKTFVIGDLHGRADLLRMALDKIYEASHSGGTVVFLGDYIDRGLHSREVLHILQGGPRVDVGEWKWVTLMGNHEVFMINSVVTGRDINLWISNGGGATLLSYGIPEGTIVRSTRDMLGISDVTMEFLNKMPLYYEDKHRIYVHAGLKPGVPLEDQERWDLTWYRYHSPNCEMRLSGDKCVRHNVTDASTEWGKHIVHGHDHDEDGPILLPNRTDLDTFAYWTGRLVIGVFDDDVPGGPVSTITVQGPTWKETYKEWRAEHPPRLNV